MVVKWSTHSEYLLASGDRDGHILLWDVRRAKNCLRYFDFNNIKSESKQEYNCGKRKHSLEILSSKLSKKTKSSYQRFSKLDNDASNKKVMNKEDFGVAHNGAANGILFCDDGKHLISFGCHDGRIRKWDVSTGINKKVEFPKLPPNKNAPKMCMQMGITSDALMPSPGLIFVPSEDSVVIFEIQTGDRFQTLNGHFSNVNCCIFNPHYQELITGGSDRNILVWEPNKSQTDAYIAHLQSKQGASDNIIPEYNTTLNALTRDNWSSSDDDTDED